MASSELAEKLARRNMLNDIASGQIDDKENNGKCQIDVPNAEHKWDLLKKVVNPQGNVKGINPKLSTVASELAAKLERRSQINDGTVEGGFQVTLSSERDTFLQRDFPEFSVNQMTVI